MRWFLMLAVILWAEAGVADDLVEDLGAFVPQFFAEFQDVESHGDRAYLFGVGGLAIMDISWPQAPLMLGRYAPPGHPYVRFYRGAVAGDYGYGGAREDGLMVVSLQPPTNPTRTTVIGEPGQSYEGCVVEQGFLFACRHAHGLQILDLGDPALPVPVGELTELSNSWDVEVRGGVAYVADGLGGLAVVDVSDPTAPALIAVHQTANAAVDVVLGDGLAAVAVGSHGVELVDISDPTEPTLLGTYDSSGLAITVVIEDDRLFIADWDDVEVVDIGNPANPQLIGREVPPARAMGLDVRAGQLHVADWSRFRTYSVGPSTRGDLQAPGPLWFGDVPAGATVDRTLMVGNTGGAPLQVTNVESFDEHFEVLSPAAFTVPAGGERPLTIRYHNTEPGYDAAFIRLESDDTDEPLELIQVSGESHPYHLNLGDPAPDFSLVDLEGVTHNLSQYRGRVVVLAFFANW